MCQCWLVLLLAMAGKTAKDIITNNNYDNEHCDEFDVCSVQGLKCVCWKFADSDGNSNKASKWRRRVNDIIGSKYPVVSLYLTQSSAERIESVVM